MGFWDSAKGVGLVQKSFDPANPWSYANEAKGGLQTTGMLGPPGAPDYRGAAAADTAQNRPDQTGPFGTTKWTKNPDGTWSQNTSLDPGLQKSQAQFEAGLGGGPQARQRAEDAIYSREQSRLDPQFAAQKQQMDSQLSAQGIDPGSEAGRRAMDQYSNNKNDAYQNAMREAIMGGGAEEQRNFEINMGGLQGLHGLTAQQGFMPGGSQLTAAEAQGGYGLGQYGAQRQAFKENTQYGNGLASTLGQGFGFA